MTTGFEEDIPLAEIGPGQVPDEAITTPEGEFRRALGAFATGVTVITTQGDGGVPYGMTANAFTSVSLEPPLVLVCVVSQTRGEEAILSNGVFAVNVLREEQESLSRFFASKERPQGRAAFTGVPHTIGASGSPLIDDCAAHVDCTVHAQHTAGDHTIFVGEVLAVAVDPDARPLLFHGGDYAALA